MTTRRVFSHHSVAKLRALNIFESEIFEKDSPPFHNFSAGWIQESSYILKDQETIEDVFRVFLARRIFRPSNRPKSKHLHRKPKLPEGSSGRHLRAECFRTVPSEQLNHIWHSVLAVFTTVFHL